MKLWVGTSGYSYKEWKGAFYPDDLPAGEMLGYYAERLPAVEINNTFYRMPTEKLLRSWADQVPADFRFVLKASRRITHQKKLADVGDDVSYLVRTAGALGERLGPILFQLPPYLRFDRSLLEEFLKLLPAGTRAAFEFRHASWLDDQTFACLENHGAALCVADAEDGLEWPRLSTADWGYLRLRRVDYEEADLAGWARRVAGQDWQQAFVFFKHEDEATGPRLAQRFLELTDQTRPG